MKKLILLAVWLFCLSMRAFAQADKDFEVLYGKASLQNGKIIFDKRGKNCLVILWYKSGGLVLLNEYGIYDAEAIISNLKNQEVQQIALPTYKVFRNPIYSKDSCEMCYEKGGSVDAQMKAFVYALPKESHVFKDEISLQWLSIPQENNNHSYQVTLLEAFEEVISQQTTQDTTIQLKVNYNNLSADTQILRISPKVRTIFRGKQEGETYLTLVQGATRDSLQKQYNTIQASLKGKTEIVQYLSMYIWFLEHQLLLDAQEMIEKAHKLMPQEKMIIFLYGCFLRNYTDLFDKQGSVQRILPKHWCKF